MVIILHVFQINGYIGHFSLFSKLAKIKNEPVFFFISLYNTPGSTPVPGNRGFSVASFSFHNTKASMFVPFACGSTVMISLVFPRPAAVTATTQMLYCQFWFRFVTRRKYTSGAASNSLMTCSVKKPKPTHSTKRLI